MIPGEFRVFVRYNDEDFCITGSYDSQQDVSGGKKSVSITSIRKQKAQSLVLSDPVEMMYTVGLDENRKLVEITRISRKPFKAATLEQPKPNTTGNNVTQQVVNNDSNETEVKQASGSTTTGLTEQLPEVNSTQKLSTLNNEPVKIDTPDQPKSPAVPNEPQETLVNAHEEKGEPNNAASNREVQPGVSNVEVDEEVKNLMVDSVDKVLAQDSGKTEEIPNSEPKRESSTINVFNGNLELRLADDIQQKLEDYKYPKNNGKYRMKIHCSKGDFNINFSKKDKDDGSVSLFINTLQKTDDKQVLSDTSKIKKFLGLEKQVTSVTIDLICEYQSVESPKREVPTNNGVPSSETTSPEAEQHTVDTDLSVNACNPL